MNNEEQQEAPALSAGVVEAVDAYLKLLGKKKLPPNISEAVKAAQTEYEATGYISALQVAMLQRCFHRARETSYEHDPLPVNVLDMAIAEELDGQPQRMLRGDEIALAIRWLAFDGDHTPEEIEWHMGSVIRGFPSPTFHKGNLRSVTMWKRRCGLCGPF